MWGERLPEGESLLERACGEPFAFLVRDYGFSGPVATRAANEFTVWYHKADKTVAITVEPFSGPIIELYYPSVDIANRRFPRRNRPAPKKARIVDHEDLLALLSAGAAELAASEHAWLSGRSR